MYGRQVNLPVDLMYGSTPHEACTLGDYAYTLRNNLTEAYVLAREKGTTDKRLCMMSSYMGLRTK